MSVFYLSFVCEAYCSFCKSIVTEKGSFSFISSFFFFLLFLTTLGGLIEFSFAHICSQLVHFYLFIFVITIDFFKRIGLLIPVYERKLYK